MDVELTVERIKALSKTKGFKMKFICGNIGVRDNYFTDCKAKKIDIPVDKLTAVATMLDTTVAYLSGETDDPYFHLSSIGMKTFHYEKSGKRPPLDAYPNPTSCGVRSSSKPKDTPYLNR